MSNLVHSFVRALAVPGGVFHGYILVSMKYTEESQGIK